MIISIKDNWKKAEHAHAKFLVRIISRFLKRQPYMGLGEAEARNFIEEIYPSLILCQQSDIMDTITLYKLYLSAFGENVAAKDGFVNRIRKTFNYNTFVQKTGDWNAYTLCKESTARTCPYCNQAYAFTLIVKGRGIRPTLDHFYSKDDYPHLALALNNLIPSCYACNSGLKLKRDFLTTPHLNPLWDDENITFSLSHKNGVASIFDDIVSDPKGTIVEISLDTPCVRSEASCDTFLITERYNELASEAADFVGSKLEYHMAQMSGIPHFTDIDEVKIVRFNPLKYRKYILGKLFLDIHNAIDRDVRAMNRNI